MVSSAIENVVLEVEVVDQQTGRSILSALSHVLIILNLDCSTDVHIIFEFEAAINITLVRGGHETCISRERPITTTGKPPLLTVFFRPQPPSPVLVAWLPCCRLFGRPFASRCRQT